MSAEQEGPLPCGHPFSALIGFRKDDPGCTVFCGECAKNNPVKLCELCGLENSPTHWIRCFPTKGIL